MIVCEHTDDIHAFWLGILHFIEDDNWIYRLYVIDSLVDSSDDFVFPKWRHDVQSHANGP